MTNKPEYPARGDMSADRKFYTHTDGSVHKFTPYPGHSPCDICSMFDDGVCQDANDICYEVRGHFELVPGAYVPTEAEAAISEACEMARAMVKRCSRLQVSGCAWCKTFTSQQCDARRYLAKHGQADAWAADMEGGGE